MKKIRHRPQTAADNQIVLVHAMPLWRDSFAGCLEFESYAVLQFATLSGWLEVKARYPRPSALIVCELEPKEIPLAARAAKEIPTIVIVEPDSPANFQQLLGQGIRGIIPANTAFNVTLNAIRLVQSGGTFVPADFWSQKQSRTDFGNLLTERQLDVVEALRQGKANKEIAHELNLRESTVKVHIRKIMRKLDAKNRTEIAVLANELMEIGRNSKNQA